MVVFHAINYYAVDLSPLLLYLRFVSGGFIFMSGYVITTFYATKWITNPSRVVGRLLVRGFKLVALFTLINLAIAALSVRNFNEIEFGLPQFVDRAFDIYLVGSGKHAAFEILLPIGYLLMLSPLVLWLKRWRLALVAGLGVAVGLSLVLRMQLNNQALLIVGFAGMLLGLFLSPGRLGSAYDLRYSAPGVLAAVLLLPWLRFRLGGYLLYVALMLKGLADAGAALPAQSLFRRTVVFCGEYVLFCYLAHILILQSIFRLLWPHRDSSMGSLLLIVALAAVLMVGSARVVAWGRGQLNCVDRVYRYVFT